MGGIAKVTQDVLPFTIAEVFPARMRVINKVGMERTGYNSIDIREIRKAFRILFMQEHRLEEAVRNIQEIFPNSQNIKLIIDAIANSQRGLARPESEVFEINVSD